MQINPILRLTFLISILIIAFFSVILIISSLASLNKMSNDTKTSLSKEQVQSINYRSETERKIDSEIRDNEGLGDMERVNINNTVKANTTDDVKSKQTGSKTTTNTTRTVLVGY